MLGGGLAPGRMPAVANHARRQLKGDGRVGTHVHVALAVDGRGQAGQVLHIGAEPVEHHHQGIVGVGVVVVGEDDQVVKAVVGHPALFSVHEFRS